MSKRPAKIGKIRAKLLGWLGVPIDLLDSGFWEEFNSGANTAGQVVNDRSVMSLSAAWSCCRIISESIGAMPLHMYSKSSNGRVREEGHPLQYILNKSPNSNSTSIVFWSAIVASMLLRGNAFAEIVYRNGRVVALVFIHPDTLCPNFKNGSLSSISVYQKNGPVRNLLRKNILHIPSFGVDGQWGMSTISYGASMFGSALAANIAANSTFEKGLSPTTALTIDRVVRKDQREEYKNAVRKISGAINSGETALLEAGMDAKTIGIKPSDAQLLESRDFSIVEICSWFGVDPSMIGHGSAVSNWGTGLEQKMIGFLTFTLSPILKRIEAAINKFLVSEIDKAKYYAEFSLEALLRADSAGRAEFYSSMVNLGVFTRDEVRELENKPRVGGNADKLTIQQGFTTLEKLGEENG